MSILSIDSSPEAFVSNANIRREVHRAVTQGKLRKLATRLYTRNQIDAHETIIRRNLWLIVSGYFPGAIIADRTVIENRPAKDGSICLIADTGRNIALPGLMLRPRLGAGVRHAREHASVARPGWHGQSHPRPQGDREAP